MDNNKPIGVLILILLIILCGVYLLIVDETHHQTENNKTSVDYMFHSRIDNKVWREIPYGNGKSQKRN